MQIHQVGSQSSASMEDFDVQLWLIQKAEGKLPPVGMNERYGKDSDQQRILIQMTEKRRDLSQWEGE